MEDQTTPKNTSISNNIITNKNNDNTTSSSSIGGGSGSGNSDSSSIISDGNRDKNNSPSEPVRSRWTPKPEQILILESIFNSGMVNPPKEETVRIRKLLEKFGAVGDANVFYWFQNRRSRSRRRQRQLQASLAASLPPPPILSGGSGGSVKFLDYGSLLNDSSNNSSNNNNNNIISDTCTANTSVVTSFAPSLYASGVDDMFSTFSCQMSGINQHQLESSGSTTPILCPSYSSTLEFQSGIITVFINGVASQVAEGPIDLKTMFGEEVILVHSSGTPVPFNDFGISFHSLQHGESYFLQRVRFAPSLYDDVRRDWESSVGKRLKDMIYRATTPNKKGLPKPCPIWIPEDIYEQLLARRRQKGFKENSKKFKENRCSGGKDGKAPGTHTMGRRNAIRMLDDMYAENQNQGKHRPGRASDLFMRSKSKKEVKGKGKEPATDNDAANDNEVVFLSQKDYKIHTEYTQRQAALEETHDVYDHNKLYFEVVNGYDKKGRVYGVGSAARRFFGRNTIGKNVKSYEPGALAAEQARNEELSRRLNEMEKWKKDMEEQMSNCRNMFTPHNQRRGDDDDDDDGGDGGGSGLAPQFFSYPIA